MNEEIMAYENDSYKVVLGETENNGKNVLCYKIINKKYAVIEGETTVLSQALEWADMFHDGIVNHSKSLTSNVVSH